MKRILFILIIILPIYTVEAKSINDLYNELNTLEEQKKLYSYIDSLEIKEVIKTSIDIELIVDVLNEEINNINKDIFDKEEEINSIKEEINNMLVFNQTSINENIYLEYIFKTDSYSELVYRYMTIKKITEYNNNLISKLNEELEVLNKKKEELNKKIENINYERERFKKLEYILKSISNNNLDNINTSLDTDINSLKREIEKYEKLGCDKNIDIALCLNLKNNESLSYPLIKGCVTKDYTISIDEIHKGIDLGCNKEGNYVYSAGYGIITNIVKESSCGGNIIWIYHLVGGRGYTTIYGHLLDIRVNLFDIVDENTVIGTVGGNTTSILNGGYDRCTNGAHLHYAIAEGHHISGYNVYTFNPRYINNYPSVLNGYFYR